MEGSWVFTFQHWKLPFLLDWLSMESCKTFHKISKLYQKCSLFDTTLPLDLSPQFSDLYHHSVSSFMQGFVSCSSSVGSMCCTYSRMFPFVRESNLPFFCCHEHLSPHRLLNPSKIRWSALRRWIRTSSAESRPSLPSLSEFSAMWGPSQQQLSTLNQCDMIERFYKSFTFICACVCVLTRVCVCECHVYIGACRDQKKALGSHELELQVFARYMTEVPGRKLTLVPESEIFNTSFLEIPMSYFEISFLVA